MDQRRKKFTKFVPYDRILDGVESEDLIDEDDSTKIIRIYHRKAHLKMFLLERLILNEKEHIQFIKEIQKYEPLNADGLLIIERWSYDMLIDSKLNKYYKFIIMFETYSTSLRVYLDNIQAKKSQMFKEDLVRLFKTFVTTLNYMQQNQIVHFNPICSDSFVICSDSQIRFNAIPILTTKRYQGVLNKAKENYLAPELLQGGQVQSSAVYSSAVFAFGILFLQIFLMKSIDGINRRQETIKVLLKEVQQKFGDVYRNYLAGMVEFDPNKRVKIHELSYNIEHSEYFVVSTYHGGPKVSFSEHFEFYKKTFQIEASMKHFTRTIAIGIPLSRSLLMANLFDKKKMFLEILDLKIHSIIPEGSVTMVTDDARILILGGAASRNVFELEESTSSLIQRCHLPTCNHNRWGFGYLLLSTMFASFYLAKMRKLNNPYLFGTERPRSQQGCHEPLRSPRAEELYLGRIPSLLETRSRMQPGDLQRRAHLQVRRKHDYRETTKHSIQDSHYLLRSKNWTRRKHPGPLCPTRWTVTTPTSCCQASVFLSRSTLLKFSFSEENSDHNKELHLTINFICTDRNSLFNSHGLITPFSQGFNRFDLSIYRKVLFMNVDQFAHNIESGEDFFYLEFGVNEFLNFGDLGLIEQIQISNNDLYLLQKRDDKYRYLSCYNYEEGFKELRKIHL